MLGKENLRRRRTHLGSQFGGEAHHGKGVMTGVTVWQNAAEAARSHLSGRGSRDDTGSGRL